MEDRERSEDWFPGQTRIGQAIIVANDVLTTSVLLKALDLDDRIKAITVSDDGHTKTWDDVCYKTGPYCLHSSLLELWSWDRATITPLTKPQIVTEVNTATTR